MVKYGNLLKGGEKEVSDKKWSNEHHMQGFWNTWVKVRYIEMNQLLPNQWTQRSLAASLWHSALVGAT